MSFATFASNVESATRRALLELERRIRTLESPSRLRLSSTTDASLSSTLHGLQIGPDSGVNLRIDNNEVLAVNNGAGSTLFLGTSGPVEIGGQPFMPAGAQISPTVTNASGWSTVVDQCRRIGPFLALYVTVTRTGSDFVTTTQVDVATLGSTAQGNSTSAWPLPTGFTTVNAAPMNGNVRARYQPSTGVISIRTFEGTWVNTGTVNFGGVILVEAA